MATRLTPVVGQQEVLAFLSFDLEFQLFLATTHLLPSLDSKLNQNMLAYDESLSFLFI